ncbi:MAG: hypothetical protein AB7D36_11140 [Oscillospiraceae bacterium]
MVDKSEIYNEIWRIRDKASNAHGHDSIAFWSEADGMLKCYALMTGTELCVIHDECQKMRYPND